MFNAMSNTTIVKYGRIHDKKCAKTRHSSTMLICLQTIDVADRYLAVNGEGEYHTFIRAMFNLALY